MATVDDVLKAMGEEDALMDENYPFQYVIDNNLRIITVPSDGVTLGVESDKDVNIVKFKMPRYYNRLDLSEFDIRINYANARGTLNYYAVTTKNIAENEITFEWLIGAQVVQYRGNVQFTVSLIKAAGDTIDKRFNTTIGTAKVLEGMTVDINIPESEIQDLLTQLTNDITNRVQPSVDEAKEAAKIAQETLTKAPYIGENDHWFVYSDGVATDTGVDARGDKGEKGDKGDPGEAGEAGPQGPQGEPGKDGTGISILGTKPSAEELPPDGNQKGDAWLVNGDLYVWSGAEWTNAGRIQGPRGPAGAGLVAGGTPGQILAKKSDADYDTEWVDNVGNTPDNTVVYEVDNKHIYTLKTSGNENINAISMANNSTGVETSFVYTNESIVGSAVAGNDIVELGIAPNLIAIETYIDNKEQGITLGNNPRIDSSGMGLYFVGNGTITSVDESPLSITATDITTTNFTTTNFTTTNFTTTNFKTKAVETSAIKLEGNTVGIVADPNATFVIGGNPAISGKMTVVKGIDFGTLLKSVSLTSDDTHTTLQIQAENGLTVNDKKVLLEGDVSSVPAGGTVGQMLVKKSDTDYDTEWVNNTGGGVPGNAVAYEVVEDPYIGKKYTLKAGENEDIKIISNSYSQDGVSAETLFTFNGVQGTLERNGAKTSFAAGANIISSLNDIGDKQEGFGLSYVGGKSALNFYGEGEIKSADRSPLKIEATNVGVSSKFNAAGDITLMNGAATTYLKLNTSTNNMLIGAKDGLFINNKKALVEGDVTGIENMTPLTAEEIKEIAGAGSGAGGGGASFEPKLLWEGTFNQGRIIISGLNKYRALLLGFGRNINTNKATRYAIAFPIDMNTTSITWGFSGIYTERLSNDNTIDLEIYTSGQAYTLLDTNTFAVNYKPKYDVFRVNHISSDPVLRFVNGSSGSAPITEIYGLW